MLRNGQLGRYCEWSRNLEILILYKFNKIEINFITCTIDLVGQGRLTTILTISISVIRCARKMIFLFHNFITITITLSIVVLIHYLSSKTNN